MRKTLISCLMAASLISVTACGDDNGAKVVPADQLDAALLTLDDFDSEWSEEMRDVFTSRDEGPPSFDPAGWCPQARDEVEDLERIEDLAGDTGAAVEFRHARQDERRMFHGISQQVWSNDDVSAYFDVLSQSFDICMGQTWTPEEGQEVSVSPLESPELGDESLALNVSIATPGPDGEYLWNSRLIIVVIDSTLMILRDLDVQLADAEPFMTDDEWWTLVDAAMVHFTSVVAGD